MESEELPREASASAGPPESEELDEFPIFRISVMRKSSEDLPKNLQFDLRPQKSR